MEDKELTALLQNTKIGIQTESAKLRERLEANLKLEEQIDARLKLMGISHVPAAIKPLLDNQKAIVNGAAVAFSSPDSHISKAMRVIYSNQAGVTTDEIIVKSGIVSNDPKKTVWNTVWKLCDDGFAKRVGAKNEIVIPTEEGIKIWEASGLALV